MLRQPLTEPSGSISLANVGICSERNKELRVENIVLREQLRLLQANSGLRTASTLASILRWFDDRHGNPDKDIRHVNGQELLNTLTAGKEEDNINPLEAHKPFGVDIIKPCNTALQRFSSKNNNEKVTRMASSVPNPKITKDTPIKEKQAILEDRVPSRFPNIKVGSSVAKPNSEKVRYNPQTKPKVAKPLYPKGYPTIPNKFKQGDQQISPNNPYEPIIIAADSSKGINNQRSVSPNKAQILRENFIRSQSYAKDQMKDSGVGESTSEKLMHMKEEAKENVRNRRDLDMNNYRFRKRYNVSPNKAQILREDSLKRKVDDKSAPKENRWQLPDLSGPKFQKDVFQSPSRRSRPPKQTDNTVNYNNSAFSRNGDSLNHDEISLSFNRNQPVEDRERPRPWNQSLLSAYTSQSGPRDSPHNISQSYAPKAPIRNQTKKMKHIEVNKIKMNKNENVDIKAAEKNTYTEKNMEEKSGTPKSTSEIILRLNDALKNKEQIPSMIMELLDVNRTSSGESYSIQFSPSTDFKVKPRPESSRPTIKDLIRQSLELVDTDKPGMQTDKQNYEVEDKEKETRDDSEKENTLLVSDNYPNNDDQGQSLASLGGASEENAAEPTNLSDHSKHTTNKNDNCSLACTKSRKSQCICKDDTNSVTNISSTDRNDSNRNASICSESDSDSTNNSVYQKKEEEIRLCERMDLLCQALEFEAARNSIALSTCSSFRQMLPPAEREMLRQLRMRMQMRKDAMDTMCCKSDDSGFDGSKRVKNSTRSNPVAPQKKIKDKATPITAEQDIFSPNFDRWWKRISRVSNQGNLAKSKFVAEISFIPADNDNSQNSKSAVTPSEISSKANKIERDINSDNINSQFLVRDPELIAGDEDILEKYSYKHESKDNNINDKLEKTAVNNNHDNKVLPDSSRSAKSSGGRTQEKTFTESSIKQSNFTIGMFSADVSSDFPRTVTTHRHSPSDAAVHTIVSDNGRDSTSNSITATNHNTEIVPVSVIIQKDDLLPSGKTRKLDNSVSFLSVPIAKKRKLKESNVRKCKSTEDDYPVAVRKNNEDESNNPSAPPQSLVDINFPLRLSDDQQRRYGAMPPIDKDVNTQNIKLIPAPQTATNVRLQNASSMEVLRSDGSISSLGFVSSRSSGQDGAHKVDSAIFIEKETEGAIGYSEDVQAFKNAILLNGRKILGELAHQLQIRLMHHLFTPNRPLSIRKRFYGMNILNAKDWIYWLTVHRESELNQEKIVSRPSSRGNENENTCDSVNANQFDRSSRSELLRTLRLLEELIATLGYTPSFHFFVGAEMVNRHGLMPFDSLQEVQSPSLQQETDIIRDTLLQLSNNPKVTRSEVNVAFVILNCLNFMASKDNGPILLIR